MHHQISSFTAAISGAFKIYMHAFFFGGGRFYIRKKKLQKYFDNYHNLLLKFVLNKNKLIILNVQVLLISNKIETVTFFKLQ